jgi:hypothetical protein
VYFFRQFDIEESLEQLREFPLVIVYAINPHFPTLLPRYQSIIFLLQGFQTLTDAEFLMFVLPGCSFFEKLISGFSIFGRYQRYHPIFAPLAQTKLDTVIVSLISCAFFATIGEVKPINIQRAPSRRDVEALVADVTPGQFETPKFFYPTITLSFVKELKLNFSLLTFLISDFFLGDSSLILSKTLAALRSAFAEQCQI